ncbi:PREDICTED: uncharacterized protein LOC105457427 [Wasmannia auropunctata]|uniref:uncharacterized protein LOC105457427 n=1 Tax=Wasmannia auropunctata TaxID=64793 RepID=UPI0005F07A0A|nr:PREDICTED: uncharacterized protein LOC105457427 [Wasmannia auropunctata]
MSRSGIFVLVLWSLMTCSFGFTMNRSVAHVPSTWDTAPSLDTYQRVFVDPTLKGKMQVTGTDRILQTEDAKILENMLENQTREKKSTTENTGAELIKMKPIEIASATRNASDSSEENANAIITPRNVILLLIDERGQDEKREEDSWRDYTERLPFAIDGFLESCHDKIKNANFSMVNGSVSEDKEKSCNCERVLRSKIEDLLTWARQTRGMIIGAVSSSNFSIPFHPRYEFSGSNESNVKEELHKSKRDFNDGWKVIDFSNRAKENSVSPLITADSKTGEDMNYDVPWDIFDVFSKIRMAFFRSLLESLHRNGGAFKDELSSRKSFSLKPTATDLIATTLRELKSEFPNDKGYMLIAVAPKSEAAAAVELLQREASEKDTLLIVTQICVGDQRSVPFAAQGPSFQIIREAKVIDDLPIAIKKAIIASDCRDTGCNRQKRDVLIVSRVPTDGISSQEMPSRNRVIRNKNAEKLSTINSEETTTKIEIQASSSASMKTCGLATVFGVMITIFAKATFS